MPCYIDRDVTGLFYSLDIYTKFKYGCVCVCVVCVLGWVQFFVTLWTLAQQGPLPMEFSKQEYWSGLPFLPPGDLPDLGIELMSLVSATL